MGKARFPKGSDEAKEYMAMIRQIAKEKRDAIANGELEPIDKPAKKEKKQKKIKEDIIFKAKEEEVIISEEEPEPEPEPVRKVKEPIEPPKKFDKKPTEGLAKQKGAKMPQIEPEPEGVIEDIEPEPIKKQKSTKPAKVVEDKPIVVKVPPKKVKKIIIEEEEEEQYEVEYRKAPPKKQVPVKKEVVNNLKDIPIDNPLLGQRTYRNR